MVMPLSGLGSSRGFAYALAVGLVVLVTAGAVAACGTDAEGIDSCRQLENARCDRAPGCGISLANPPHEGAPDSDVDACKRYYKDACLHGLVSRKDPGDVEVEACEAAIRNGSCDVVKVPSTDPACVFLLEAPPSDDAGTDPDAGDAGTDASALENLADASPF